MFYRDTLLLFEFKELRNILLFAFLYEFVVHFLDVVLVHHKHTVDVRLIWSLLFI